MKNIISIEIELDLSTVAKVYHNQQLLASITTSGVYTFDIESDQTKNVFWITTNGITTLNYLTMFDMGRDKLVYYGICKTDDLEYQSQEINSGQHWRLEYTMPVFTWLHYVLQHGWLVGP